MSRFLKQSLKLTVMTALAVQMISLSGCVCPAPAGQKQAAPVPAKAVAAPPSGQTVVEQTFPNCAPDGNAVRLRKTAPAEIAAGRQFEYQMQVTNLTECSLKDVVVKETFAENFIYQSSAPAAQVQGAVATWALGTLGPGESKTITVIGVANDQGEVTACAEVAYSSELCMTIAVVQPALKLVKTAPAEVLLCDPIPLTFTVTNTGTGVARDVVITDNLPDGLTTADGGSEISIQAGDLTAGQSYETSVTVVSAKTGNYQNTATAVSAEGLEAEAATNTVVRRPVLEIAKQARAEQFAGRPIEYEITIVNRGDAEAADLRVQDILPAQVAFAGASDGGSLQDNNTVAWNLPALAPAASKTLTVRVNTVAVGRAVNEVRAVATCAQPVRAMAETNIVGVPAVLLEVVDLEDPIEVGGQTTYEISATNQGFADATNVRIVCELEATQKFVAAGGATEPVATGQVVEFAPLGVLAPKAKAVWRVAVTAAEVGDVRFTVRMNVDQLERPVMETEATNQY